MGDNVWTGDMTVANELDVDVAAGNSLQVDGNITGQYLYNYDAGHLVLDGSANVIQYQVYNYGVLEVDGTTQRALSGYCLQLRHAPGDRHGQHRRALLFRLQLRHT